MKTTTITTLLLATVLASSIFLATVFVVPAAGAKPNNTGNINKLMGAQTYLLNILGKKSTWNGQPEYDSNRHTMFVPENVPEFLEITGYEDVKIWVNRGSIFAVTDPNAFDDSECALQMGFGKYEVYFVALGKPGMTAKLDGWTWNASANDGAGEYLFKVGEVTVTHKKKPVWESGHDIFYVSEEEAATILTELEVAWPWPGEEAWIFDFIDWLARFTEYEYLYLWKLVSGCKHIQIRFYKVG